MRKVKTRFCAWVLTLMGISACGPGAPKMYGVPSGFEDMYGVPQAELYPEDVPESCEETAAAGGEISNEQEETE